MGAKRGQEEHEGAASASASPGGGRKWQRQRPEATDETPWRRFLPPHGPLASRHDWLVGLGGDGGGGVLAALEEHVRRLRCGPAAVGPDSPAAVGRAMECLVGRWTRGRWGQPLLPSLGMAAVKGEEEKDAAGGGGGIEEEEEEQQQQRRQQQLASTISASSAADPQRVWRDAQVRIHNQA